MDSSTKVPSSLESSVTPNNNNDKSDQVSPAANEAVNQGDQQNTSLIMQKSSTTSSSSQQMDNSINTTNNIGNNKMLNNSNNNSLDSVMSDADQEAIERRTPSSSCSSSSNQVTSGLISQQTSDTGLQSGLRSAETTPAAPDALNEVLTEEESLSLIPPSLPQTSNASELLEDHLPNDGLHTPHTPSGPPTSCSTPVGHSPSGVMSTPGTPSGPPSHPGQLPLNQPMVGQQQFHQRMPLPPSGQSPQQHQPMQFPQQPMMGQPHPGQYHPGNNMPPQQPMMPGMQGPPGMGPQVMQGPSMGMPVRAQGPHSSKGGIHAGDSQYSQHQSQIFVFSTQMANAAAFAVDQRKFQTIIEWHCEREETKQFLQTNPLKTEQFNRQNHTAWLNSLSKSKGQMPRMPHQGMQGHSMSPGMHGPFGAPGINSMNRPPFGPNGPMTGQWNDPRMRGEGNWSGPPGQGVPGQGVPGQGVPGQGFPPNQGQFQGNPRFPTHVHPNNSAMHANGIPHFHPNNHPSMMQQQQANMPQGMNRMEEENLTPQQKQHREEKLATLRQLQHNLQPVLGEQQHQPQPGQQFGPPVMRPEMGEMMSDPNMMHNHAHNHHMNASAPQDWMNGPPVAEANQPPSTTRKRGRQTPSVSSPSANLIANSPRGHLSQALPPPPYQGQHRGSSGSITSPLPASPANLPLPSPRMTSPADSSRQQQQRPNAYPSPGTPSGAELMSLNSPKPHLNGPRSSGRKSNPSDMKNNDVLTDLHLNSKSPLGSSNMKMEAQLMPVPSPQQIQYSLNAFEGQELTIQKQPNTSLRDPEMISPPDINASFESHDHFHGQMPSGGPSFPGMNENGMRFNNSNMDRFGPMTNGPPGHFNDMHPRFTNPDSMQRMHFEGQRGPHPGMNGPQFGQMDGNMRMEGPNMRFSGPQFMHGHPSGLRMRGPPPPDMNRFPGPPGPQFPNSGPNDMPSFSGNNNMMPGPPSDRAFNPNSGEPVSSTHLANLQKMAPPFDIGSLQSKTDSPSPMNPMLPGPGMNMPRPGSGQFDPLSSMASLADSPGPQGMMAPPGSGMSIASSSSNTSVNFHTQMSSMQNMNHGQNMNNCPSGSGMPFGSSNSAMMGGPQTVNNTYVNANLSIQQLNIQGGCGFEGNSGPGNMPMHPNQMHGNNMGMNDRMSPKMGRPPGNNFSGNGPRGPNGQNFGPGMQGPPPSAPTSGPGSRGPRGSGNKPNTIQYHPRNPGQMNQPQQKPPPNMDFLSYEGKGGPPLGHNMPFYPKDGNAIQGPRGPPMTQGGRPPLMMRSQNAMQGQRPQMQHQMSNFPPDFNRGNFNQGPNNGGNNNMMSGPPQGNFIPQGHLYGPSISPGIGIDSSQPLPPSFNNYAPKQGPPNSGQGPPQPGNFPNQSHNPNDPNYQ